MNQPHPRHKRLLKLRAPRAWSKASNYMLSDNHKFDETTGQVYTETTASIQSADDRDWTRRTLGPSWRDSEDELQPRKSSQEGLKDYRDYLRSVKSLKARRLKGVRSLQATSFESVLQHMSDVTLEGLECLPIQVIRRLWHAVNRRCILSFDTWTIFSKLLYQDEEATLNVLRYRQEIKTPISPLHVYTSPLTSLSFDFISSLSITVAFPLPDLVKISTLRNLGALEIINSSKSKLSSGVETPSAVTDRLIRTWHYAAVEDGAFRVLRIMRLWGHPELTPKSLVYLDSFPALAIYDVRWCAFNFDKSLGLAAFNCPKWKPNPEPNILDFLVSVCVERAMMMQRKSGIEATPIRGGFPSQLGDESRVGRLPRFEVVNFLTQSPKTVQGGAPAERNMFTQIREHKEMTDYRVAEKRNRYATPYRVKTWESATNAIFSRIGELRNDTDLSRAGIEFGDQAIVADELINSIPIASVRLGPSTGWMMDWHDSIYDDSMFHLKSKFREDKLRGRGLFFIRIKVPKEPVGKDEAVVSASALPGNKVAGEAGTEASLPGATQERASSSNKTHAKPRRSTIMGSKKRKIGDMLRSFN